MKQIIFESAVTTSGIKSQVFEGVPKDKKYLYIDYTKGLETQVELKIFSSSNGQDYFGNVLPQFSETEVININDNIIEPVPTTIKLTATTKVKLKIELDNYNLIEAKSITSNAALGALKIYIN